MGEYGSAVVNLDESWGMILLGGLGGLVAGIFGIVGIVAGIIFLIASRFVKTAKNKLGLLIAGLVSILIGVVVTLVTWGLSDMGFTTDDVIASPFVICAPGFLLTDPIARMLAPKTTLPAGTGTDRTKDTTEIKGLQLPNDNAKWVADYFSARCAQKDTLFDPPRTPTQPRAPAPGPASGVQVRPR